MNAFFNKDANPVDRPLSTGSNGSFIQQAQNNTAKTGANAIEVPSVALPKGGGAMKGIDEKFSVNAVNGTVSFSIPLPFSTARGVSPALSLSYNSGGGNSIFGLGWNLALASIKRKTDKGLPRYEEANDSDTFLFSDAEDLVPEFRKDANGVFLLDAAGEYRVYEEDDPNGLFVIRFYRPRIEGLFARIERWCRKSTGEIKWRIITRDNTTTLLGWSEAARISDPANPLRIFEWLPEFVFDDKGNCAHYIYKKEDDKGLDNTLPHNRNRYLNNNITYTNTYPDKVLYGNTTPYRNFGDVYPAETSYLFSTVFDYGGYDDNNWDYRTDAFSDYRAGFEIRTTRLCKSVLLYHHFKGAGEYDGLVRSVNFGYDTAQEQGFTFLRSITSVGYIKKPDGSYASKQWPPLEFDYQRHEWNDTVKEIAPASLVHAPAGLEGASFQFTDLFNEGLSGILTEQADAWYYKQNLGNGVFEEARLVAPKPSFTGLGRQLQLADLDADGGKQLVKVSTAPQGYYELDESGEWQGLHPFRQLPVLDLNDANMRMIDLDGDGRPEIVISEDHVFTWYPSAGRDGFLQAQRATKPFDEEEGAHLVFSDELQRIFLADMSGDGLTDLVRIRNGEVCYWPNMGYGKFGAKITMDNAPIFDPADAFNPAYIKLADIDGSGTTDIIYLGRNNFTCWMNISGNHFTKDPFSINHFPEIHNEAIVTVTDLLGNGVACIVWSSPLPGAHAASIRYIDLMNSKKPHLLIAYKNNTGKEVLLEYTPSTKYYIEDKLAGRPWVTKLHFPVHCVSGTETRDKITGHRFVSSYSYHHGYYDHAEREFRGFGRVDQTDAEYFEHWVKGNASNIVDKELHQEPVVTSTWFHTGAFMGGEKILHQFAQEYWYEEMRRRGFTAVHYETDLPDARLLLSPALAPMSIDKVSTLEWRQAVRACKGIALRTEIFARDAARNGNTAIAMQNELTPFTVAASNCLIKMLQPKGKNRFAVFVAQESESITYGYERSTDDPRIAHNLTIKLDDYGHVLESASVLYPNASPDTTIPPETLREQAKTIIRYTKNQFTNDSTGDNIYRLRLPSESTTFELKGITKTGTLYTPADFNNVLAGAQDMPYHQADAVPAAGHSQKRLIEHTRTIYRSNDLLNALPLHRLEFRALPFESYQLAYTPALLDDIYGTKTNAALMNEGRFTHSEGDDNWWIRSGTVQFLDAAETIADVQNRFYTPVAYTDPYGAQTKVKHYGTYFLFIEQTEDALGNTIKVDKFNFRTLSPQRMKDMNGNFSEVLEDELGIVKAMAVMGKGTEADDLDGLSEITGAAETMQIDNFFNAADTVQLTSLGKILLQHASARFVYDLEAYRLTGKPVVITSIVREEHFSKNNNSPIQLGFEYSNGLGSIVMKKMQAEPGLAKKLLVHPNNTYTVTEEDTSMANPVQLRWIGNGRTILNNKGNPVKQYEPYFSTSHHYDNQKELVETGVTPILYYDALGRLIKTEMPDGTFSKVVFNSWMQLAYDANDTVLDSSWYTNRTNRLIDAQFLSAGKDPVREKASADQTALHANTPAAIHFDNMGRPVLSIDHNRDTDTQADEFYNTRLTLDIEGNLRQVTDARDNTVMQYKYDMLGNRVYQKSMDAGQRWLLLNCLGDPLQTWDERNHVFKFFYDILHRPTYSKITGGDEPLPLDHIFQRMVYGESLLSPGRTNEATLQVNNILGRVIQQYDTGGLIDTPVYDFKGQALSTTRRLFRKYKETVNWTDANLANDLETDTYTFTTETDALGRLTRQTAPDGSIMVPSYNATGLLEKETVTHQNPTQTNVYIKDIDYNEKGQRNKIIYGNDVSTRFYYDRETFRLNRLETKKQNNEPLQDWHYTFDPVGNIVQIEDKNIPVVFFNNQKVTGVSTYTYDALYRLVAATGRENDAALSFSSEDNWNDLPFKNRLNPGDAMAMHGYTQRYRYDRAGNITQMRHVATGNSWTRDYTYETAGNRLQSTQIGNTVYEYTHHPVHGFIHVMPHLQELEWNFKEEITKTIRQKRNDGGSPETTYYQYDAQGQRIRKITETAAGAGITATKKEERIYIAGYELYTNYSGTNAGLQRETLSLMDGDHRFAMIETRNDVDDGTDKRSIRYQLHNHLGSATLELDAGAAVISYEEFHSYGTTAYQAVNGAIRCTAKRYRYTGMERDEETGLSYHAARYYVPWLGRWMSCDPIGIGSCLNLYRYASCNPISNHDRNGCDDKRFDKMTPEERAKAAAPLLNIRARQAENAAKAADPTPEIPEWKTRPYEEPTEVKIVKKGVMLLIGGILAVPTGGGSVLVTLTAVGAISAGGAITMTGVSIGIAKDVQPVSQADEKNAIMATDIAANMSNPGGALGSVTGALVAQTPEGVVEFGDVGTKANDALIMIEKLPAPAPKKGIDPLRKGKVNEEMAEYSLRNANPDNYGGTDFGKTTLKNSAGKTTYTGTGRKGARIPDPRVPAPLEGKGPDAKSGIELKARFGDRITDPAFDTEALEQLQKEEKIFNINKGNVFAGPKDNLYPYVPGEGTGVATGWWYWKPPHNIQ